MSELESKQTLPRSEIAEYLHEFADELDTDHDDTGHDDIDHDDAVDTGELVDERESMDTGDPHSPDEPIEGGESDRADPETGERLPPEDDASGTAEHTDATSPEDRVTLIVGDDSATVNPPETADFEIEVDSDSSLVGSREQQRVTFELEWEVEEVTDENEIEIT